MDLDRSNARGRRSRHDCSFRLNQARRQNTRADGERRDRARRWCARTHQRVGDNDYLARCARTGRRASARAKPVGRFHHCDDHTGRIDHGNRLTHGKSECNDSHDFRIARAGVWRLGWTISRALS